MTERDTLSGVRHSRMWHRAFEQIEFGPVPVVAALKGAVVGGGLELAAAAHLRVAERSTFYALPEGMRGIFVGGGASVRRAAADRRGADGRPDADRPALRRGGGCGRRALAVRRGRRRRPRHGARAGRPDRGQRARRPTSRSIQALPRIAEASPREGYFMEAMMAAIAQGTDDAKEPDAGLPRRPRREGDRSVSATDRPPPSAPVTCSGAAGGRPGDARRSVTSCPGCASTAASTCATTTRCGAGRWRTSTDSGRRSGSSSRSPTTARGTRAASSGPCPGPGGSPARCSTTPSTRCAAPVRPTPTSPCTRGRRPVPTLD